VISDFAFTSIINHERKGYGYATMKVDAIQWFFLATKIYGKNQILKYIS